MDPEIVVMDLHVTVRHTAAIPALFERLRAVVASRVGVALKRIDIEVVEVRDA